jgi:hypothetical protein
MNLGDKVGLDAMLKDWTPPPPGGSGPELDEERIWEERADATVKAALAAKEAPGDVDALLADPTLPPEPGESGAREKSAPSISPPAERRRGSLKEIAARASQAGARPSSPGPRPSTPGAPPSIPAPAALPSRTPLPMPRPSEAGKDDSGVINLNVVQASVTAQERAAAEKAQPGQVGLFADDKTEESPVNPAQIPTPAKAPNVAVITPRRNNTGPIAGGVIAVLGIAAAFAIISRKPPSSAPVADNRPAVTVEAKQAAPNAAPPSVTPSPSAKAESTSVADLPNATPDPVKAPAAGDPARVATAPSQAAAPSKDTPEPAKTAVASAPTGKSGDLQDEMKRAVGPVDNPNAPVAPTPEPAAGHSGNQNIPEQPSQGSVQAAIGAVISGAKACVSGADDVSRAQVTFSSQGTVTSVSVSGWAAAHGKSACVQAALKGAKVGQFSKGSFVVGVPIRP